MFLWVAEDLDLLARSDSFLHSGFIYPVPYTGDVLVSQVLGLKMLEGVTQKCL
jgi:hypothetical protein